MRTQDEIVTRFEAAIEDMFGFQREVLLGAMDYEHAKPFLKEGVTEAEWEESRADTAEAARGYYDFALGKIQDHRGISAGRSVEKADRVRVAARPRRRGCRHGSRRVHELWCAEGQGVRRGYGLPVAD